ncbi:MAG: tail fiber domain-containing protein [bacterium]|nr:tail fiber domain-containing protein [bacterium]
MTLEGTGNVGIGTTAPRDHFDIAGTYNSISFGHPAINDNNITMRGTPDGTGFHHAKIYSGRDTTVNTYGSYLSFYTEGKESGTTDTSSEKVRIQSNGNVGIGTTDPQGNLHIYGTSPVRILGESSTYTGTEYVDFMARYTPGASDLGGMRIQRQTSGNIDTLLYAAISGQVAAEVMRISGSGNVGIGTTNPLYQLQLSTDSAAKPTTNTWTVPSDQKLKTNISAFTDGLAVINQINPVNYTLNGLAGTPAGAQGIGVIAQDILPFAPYTVSSYNAKLNPTDATTTQLYNFNSGDLTFVMINAIKELSKNVASSTADLNALGSGFYITDSLGTPIFSRSRAIGALPNRDMELTALNILLDGNTTITGNVSMSTSTINNLCLGGVCKNAWDNLSGYLTSFTETDPLFTASASYGIGSADIANWNNYESRIINNESWINTASSSLSFDATGKIVIGRNPLNPPLQGGQEARVEIVDITTITASSTGAAFVVNQVGIGEIADFQAQGGSVMSIASAGEVKIVGSLLVDGRIMLCTGGQCSNTLDSAVDETMADLGVEGKVVAGAFEGYCGEGYSWVPGSAKYGTMPGFCVMNSLMNNPPDPLYQGGTIWTNVSQGEAQVACQTLGTGYHLLGENEWLTMAENILQVAANDADANAAGMQLGTSTAFTLTSDNIIYNLAGTVKEWTNQNVTAAGLPIAPSADAWYEYGDVSDYKGMNIAPDYYLTDAANNIGKIYTGSGIGLRGFVRGSGGIYGLDLSHTPSEQSASIGFRCAK